MDYAPQLTLGENQKRREEKYNLTIYTGIIQ